MTADLSIRITIEHGGTTVTSHLAEDDSDIHGVVEAIDHALRGIGFDAQVIHGAFAQYAPDESTGDGSAS